VVPIFKGRKRNLIKNYRGIALLSAMPKLFELLVFGSLFFHSFMELFTIAVVQHGFFKGRSAVSNLNEFASLCIRWMEEGFQTDAVYTDFLKAFDRINHLVNLLAKLRSYGIVSELNLWFSSYLRGRTQAIRIAKHESEVIYVKLGVPQGSHLGPLLFLLFINDVVSNIFESLSVLLYADNMKLYAEIGVIEDCYAVQRDLDRLCAWRCDVNLRT
jgi:hypothetical protein